MKYRLSKQWPDSGCPLYNKPSSGALTRSERAHEQTPVHLDRKLAIGGEFLVSAHLPSSGAWKQSEHAKVKTPAWVGGFVLGDVCGRPSRGLKVCWDLTGLMVHMPHWD